MFLTFDRAGATTDDAQLVWHILGQLTQRNSDQSISPITIRCVHLHLKIATHMKPYIPLEDISGLQRQDTNRNRQHQTLHISQ